jgi:Chaperone of endosialidase
MALFPNSRNLALSLSLAVISAILLLAQPTRTLAATSLGQCVGSNRQSVVKCCLQATAGHPPGWMTEARSSCKQSVICGGKAGARKCRVAKLDNQLTRGKDDSGKRSISDMRLKTDIHRVGTTVLNLPLYSFQYRGQPAIYIGVMAQDVMKVEPSAVSIGSNGYYEVDYGKLGIRMLRLH